MTSIKQLNPADILFLAGESEHIYHHTAGLVVLDTSAVKRFDFEHFRKRCIQRMEQVPHFHWKLHQVPMGLDLPYWVADDNFSWDNHFKRIAVPAPGDRQALAEVAGFIYSRHLDRSKPLWEMWYIEGLEGGKVAIMQKTHHCMMDGQGMQKLGELLSDFSPRGKMKAVAPEIAEARPGVIPDPRQVWENTLLRWLGFPLKTGKGLASMLGPQLGKRLKKKRDEEKGPELPRVFFNAEICADRGFVYGTLPLADIKRVKDAFDVTVNDVILGLVSATLRDYLHNYEELPAESLRAAMAVSLRSEEDDSISNKVTSTPVSLATDIADPLERLQAISAASDAAKTAARGGGVGMVEVMQSLPPLLVHSMTMTVGPDQAPAMMGANVVVSNVRGSPKPMYIAGARLECMYPISVLTTGIGLNVTCVSYGDGVDFGFTLAPELFRAPWALVDGLEASLAEYLALIPGKPRASRKKNRRSARTVK